MEHDNNIIIGEDFEPMLVAHAITSAYVERPTSPAEKSIAKMCGAEQCETRLCDRFTLDELDAIANHIRVYVDMKRREEQ